MGLIWGKGERGEARITPRLAQKDEIAVGTVMEDEMQVVQTKSEPSRYEFLKPCTLQREAGL